MAHLQSPHSQGFVVALGPQRYVVERPWGALPAAAGKVTDVSADSQGHVYVLTRRDPYVDPVCDPVHVLAANGTHLRSFGAARILDAHMIACDGADRIWVVDRDCHEIVAFDSEGREVAALGSRHGPLDPFNHPSDLAFGRNTIAVADGYANGRVHLFERDGTPRLAFGEVGTAPGHFLTAHGIWVAGDGRILVADRENHRVQVFSPDGALGAVWTGFHRPSDIWGDAEGRFYITDGVPTLTLLAGDGARLGRCRPVNNGAHGLWGSASGDLYLAEGNPSRITRLRPLP